MNGPYPLMLASKSAARRRMLSQVGIEPLLFDPAIDETEVKRGLIAANASPIQVAETLAELKGQKASLLNPGVMIVASDQVLSCEGKLYDKARSLNDAHEILNSLSGKSHELETSVCIILDGQRLWHWNETAFIAIKSLNQQEIRAYLAIVGLDILSSVGCYRVESEGALIFSKITGDPYTIQGLPLIPLLQQLRQLGYPILGEA